MTAMCQKNADAPESRPLKNNTTSRIESFLTIRLLLDIVGDVEPYHGNGIPTAVETYFASRKAPLNLTLTAPSNRALNPSNEANRLPNRNAITLYREHSPHDFLLPSISKTSHIMIAKFALVGGIAALLTVAHAQDDNVQQAPTIFDRVDLPFTFTDCAAPTEMEQCWKAQNYTNEYLDPWCSGLQNRIDCALTNCWNRVCLTHMLQPYTNLATTNISKGLLM